MSEIKADFILEGGILSMQSAQTTLQDAVKAYDAGSYATATIMGAVAAEHLARCHWLLDYGVKIGEGTVECENFEKDFGGYVDTAGHEERLQHCLYGFTFKLPRTVREVLASYKGSEEERVKSMLRSIDRMRNKAGSSFHDLREQAQYVEPLTNCSGWR
jgi:AbiV family abortive infection protein